MKYHDKKKYCWRRGDITFTEHLNAHIGESRHSGQYGTGVYCYENLHPALGLSLGRKFEAERYDPSKAGLGGPLLKLDISNLNLFEPRDLRWLENFSKLLRKLVWHYYETPVEKRDIRWIEQYHQLREEIDEEAERLRAKEPALKPMYDYRVSDALVDTIECLESKDPTICPQPINKALERAGFDGIKPLTDLSNESRWGILIFKESARKIGCIFNSHKHKRDKEKVSSICDIPFIEEEIESFLEDEIKEEYLQLTTKTRFTNRLDFHNRLEITEEMSLEDKKKQINEMFGHCLNWAFAPELEPTKEDWERAKTEQNQECELIRDFYLNQLKKREKDERKKEEK